MMKALIRNERKILINTMQSQPVKNYIIYLILLIVTGFIIVLVSSGIWFIGPSISSENLTVILTYVCIAIIGFIALLGIPHVFKHLYSNEDLNLLFTLPIKTRHIFLMKYLQNFGGVPLFAMVIVMIPTAVFGIVTHAHFMYYPVMVIIILAVCVIGLSLAYLFNLLLIQIVPKSRASEFMTIMSMLSGIIIYFVLVSTNIMDGTSTDSIVSDLPTVPNWLPLSWASHAIVQAANGSISFLLPFISVLLFSAIMMLLTLSVVEKGFRTGWIRLSEGSKRKKKSVKGVKKYKVRRPTIAVGIKEWFAIKRDVREWFVFMPLGFVAVFIFVGLFNGEVYIGDIREFNQLSWPIAQGVLLFLYAIVNGYLAAASIGREGSSVWVLRTLPLTGRQIAFGKFWISWLIPFVLLTGIEIIAGLILSWTILQLLGGIVIKAIITMGISAIGLSLGTIGAKYNPLNPQARLNVGMSILLVITSYVYLFLSMIPYVVLLIPVEALEFVVEISNELPGIFGTIVGVLALFLSWKASYPILIITLFIGFLLLISLVITGVFLQIGADRIEKGIKIDMVSESRTKPLFGRKKGAGL